MADVQTNADTAMPVSANSTSAEATTPSSIQSSRSRLIPTISTKSLSVLVTGMVMLAAIIKADPKDIPIMVRAMVESSPWATVGWVLAIVFLIGGLVFVVTLSKVQGAEITRLAKERDKLQNKLLDIVKKS
jgi:hypothetical protein